MRPIDADALVAEIKKDDTYQNWLFRKMIEKQPTISPDEVRGVGEWKMWEDYYGSNVYQCSVCGADWDMIDGTPEDNDMNYCPHCGAKIEVSEDA